MTRKRLSTEDFIADLARAPVPKPFSASSIALWTSAATALGVALWLSLMGLRPDLGTALSAPVTLAKTGLPALLSVSALWLAIRSGYPGKGLRLSYLLLPPAMALVLIADAAAATPAPFLTQAMVGSTAMKCLSAVLGLSLLPIAAGLTFLKNGASTNPALSGALLGLAAGAGAAAGYSLACTEDSPLFYVVWYGLAIASAGAVGSLAGSRLLRW